MILWNDKVKLIISDVDDTVAKVFNFVQPEMIIEIEKLLAVGIFIFFISGQSYTNIYTRLIQFFNKKLLENVLIGYCNGAEVAGFDEQGNQIAKPLFSITNLIDKPIDSELWEKTIQTLLSEFLLTPHPVMKINQFKQITKNDPFSILYENRRLQISLDFINNRDPIHWVQKGLNNLIFQQDNDIRISIQRRARELLTKENLPIEPHLAGTFAIDFNIQGVNKALPLKKLINFRPQFELTLPNNIVITNYDEVEIWGDNFTNGNADFYMSSALPGATRSITFRNENSNKFPTGYNIVQWNGKYQLNEGLLEYLQNK